MEVVINNIPLSQVQLDAIVPVLNMAMQKRMSKKVLEAKCIEAMAIAGCPLGPLTAETAPLTNGLPKI